jgi:hypothetical protein
MSLFANMPRAKVQGAPVTKDIPIALLPILAELRAVKDAMGVMRLFEESVPDHLQAKAVAAMIGRPALFRPEVIADAIRLIGFKALARTMGVNQAHAAYTRFCGVDVAA